MILVVATVLIQIGCVVHLIRSHRNSLWLWAIIGLPVAGAAVYLVVEILPGLRKDTEMYDWAARTLAELRGI